MAKVVYALLFLAVAFAGILPPPVSRAGGQVESQLPEPPSGKVWRLVWHDEFEGTRLDETKWASPPAGPRRGGWWLPEAVKLDGQGHLVIQTYWDGSRYVDGCVRTRDKFEPTFGWFEARIRFQRQPGHWSAFWLYNDSVGSTANAGRDGTEIDIMERPWLDDRVQHALHWDGYGSQHKSDGKVVEVPGIMEGFHTFALWWTPEEYRFYVDGQETWRTSAGGVCQVPLYIKLSDEIGDWAGTIRREQLPDEFLVDYVRVYQLADAADAETGELGRRLLFPHFADGIWAGVANRSRIVLDNRSPETTSGTVRFHNPEGGPATVAVAGEIRDGVPFQLAPGATAEIVTDGLGPLQAGAVRVEVESPPESAGGRLEGGLIFSVLGHSVSVPESPARPRQRFYVSVNEVERTGIALYNPSTSRGAVVRLRLRNLLGAEVGRSEMRLDPGRQRARFLDEAELFGSLLRDVPSFAGTLEIAVAGDGAVSALGLIQRRDDGSLMTVPAGALDAAQPGRLCAALVTASDSLGDSPQYLPAAATDANFHTRWRSRERTAWLQVDLGAVHYGEGLDIYWDLTEFASSYQVSTSLDAQRWDVVYSTDSGHGGFPESILFAARPFRYLRIQSLAAGSSSISIWELRLIPDDPCNTPSWVEEQVERVLAAMTLEEKCSFVHGETAMSLRAIPRLGIPPLLLADGPLGLRWGQATAFPAAIALAASWDVKLAGRFGTAVGREWKNKGRHMWLGPGMNIIRVPQNGRNFEYYSEDPWLASRMAVAAVRGAQAEGIIATPKHYAANNQEYQRYSIDIQVAERALREIYLQPFRAAVTEAGAWSVMAAYNRVNGAHCTENTWLLQDVLKEEWGFRGFVVSDWGASHSTVGTANNGLDLEMDGANPVGAWWGRGQLLAAVRNGQVAEATVDDKVRRILRAMFSSGILPEPHPAPDLQMTEHWALAREIAREGSVLLKNEGGLLPLDPEASRTIAVIGPNLAVARTGGGGSSQVTPYRAVSPLEGIRQAVGPNVNLLEIPGAYLGGNTIPPVDPSYLWDSTAPLQGRIRGEYFTNPNLQGTPALVRHDSSLDFNWGAGSPQPGTIPADRFSVRWTGRLKVPVSGNYLLGTISDDGVRVFLDGQPIIDNWTDHPAHLDQVERRLEGNRFYSLEIRYYENGGDAVLRFGCLRNDLLEEALDAAAAADTAVLFVGLSADLEGEGFDRPSIDLPAPQIELIQQVAAVNPRTVVVVIAGSQVGMDSWIDRVPAVLYAWYPGQEGGFAIADLLFGSANPSGRLPMTFVRRWDQHPAATLYPGGQYSDGIYVGYRYFDSFGVEPLFPFGHGLSYTTFAYDGLEIDSSGWAETGVATVSLEVTNTGEREGSEVVQLYVRDPECTVDRPEKELKRFAKVRLAPGESRRVEFQLDWEALAFWDPNLGAWHVEPGRFDVLVGASSRDIRLEGGFELSAEELAAPAPVLVFPQFASGESEGWRNRTRLILTQAGTDTFAGRIRFLDPAGRPLAVDLEETATDEVVFELPAGGSLDLSTSGTGPLATGVVRVEGLPQGGSGAAPERAPKASALSGVLIYELFGHRVSVPASPARRWHRLYVSQTVTERTGVALYNPTGEPVRVELRLRGEDGGEAADAELELAASERWAGFLDEVEGLAGILGPAAADFRGSVEIRVVNGGPVCSLGLIQSRRDGSLVAVTLDARD
jgi:beta-glucosidase